MNWTGLSTDNLNTCIELEMESKAYATENLNAWRVHNHPLQLQNEVCKALQFPRGDSI